MMYALLTANRKAPFFRPFSAVLGRKRKKKWQPEKRKKTVTTASAGNMFICKGPCRLWRGVFFPGKAREIFSLSATLVTRLNHFCGRKWLQYV